MSIILRDATPEDVQSLAFLEAQCFTAPWSYSLLADEFEPTIGVKKLCLVAMTIDNQIVGYLCAQTVMDTTDLLRVAVCPDYRRQGIARDLISEWLNRNRADKVQTAFLEVRASNQKAIMLYQKVGFLQQTILKDYYEKPRENGFLFSKELK